MRPQLHRQTLADYTPRRARYRPHQTETVVPALMNIIFSKSKWEMWDDSCEVFLQRTKEDGFSATEIYLRSVQETPDEIVALHREHGLDLIAQILTEGDTPDAHLRSLEEQMEFAMRCNPLFVNHHAGRDRFSFEDNVRIFQRLIDLSHETGLPMLVETHRGRPTYSAVETRKYLDALPELHLTADFSHWMVVHESDLSDQPETLDLAIQRSHHIHARVGYEEGPQVPDPRAPEWEQHVSRHLTLWQQIVDVHQQRGTEVLTITPEFGPPNYMHTLPFSNEPVGDVWKINVYMRDLLQQTLQVSSDDPT